MRGWFGATIVLVKYLLCTLIMGCPAGVYVGRHTATVSGGLSSDNMSCIRSIFSMTFSNDWACKPVMDAPCLRCSRIRSALDGLIEQAVSMTWHYCCSTHEGLEIGGNMHSWMIPWIRNNAGSIELVSLFLIAKRQDLGSSNMATEYWESYHHEASVTWSSLLISLNSHQHQLADCKAHLNGQEFESAR